ncbi:MAG TPA: MMPL family transporter [Methylomirabilota bacterium]|nr:MMPL family transporter [Methylomirabilota bacterium]
MFEAWGRLVYRLRWWLVGLSALSLAGAAALMSQGGRLEAETVLSGTESGRAIDLMVKELPPRPALFVLILSSRSMRIQDPAFRAEVERALAPLRADRRVARVRTAWDAGAPDPRYVSRDGHRTLAVVELTERASSFASLEFSSLPPDLYPSLRGKVRSDALDIVAAGGIPLNHDFQEVAKRDLTRAEAVILPVVGLLLLIAFGTVVAALLPLAVGLLAMAGGLAGTYWLARSTSVTVYAPNIVTMIGLGVAIDYSLFIVSRFREEVRRHAVPDALGRTMATAGRAILFSGMTVAIGLLGMLLLGLGNVGTLGVAGTLVVSLAVFYALTFLPAVLGILGKRVDAGRLPLLHGRPTALTSRFWHRVAAVVMAHPWRVLLPVTALLLLLGVPFLHLRVGAGGATSLPPTAESRRGDELLREEFPGGEVTRVAVLLRYREGSPLTAERIGEAFDLSRWLAGQRGVRRVDSLVDLQSGMTRAQYQQLAALSRAQRPPSLQAAMAQTVGQHILLLVAYTNWPAESDEARELVRTIRRSHPPVSGDVLVAGRTAYDLDFAALIGENALLAIGLVMVATYGALFLLLGSVLLPLKAVVMNLLSITASYGALVWIFQDGHLARWLNFTPGPVQTATPIIMFCLVFGLSMDYEVLLLSRIREEYLRSGDNSAAVGAGLERTGRLITWAALIMAAVFFAFALADSVIIKAVGIGIGIAVVLDATVVRVLLVPATMRLMGSWNWWAPAWIGGLRGRLRTRATR